MESNKNAFSYKAKLPSTGRSILLVGASHLTQSLAAALVQVQFDEPSAAAKQHDDPAIEALRKHCCTTPTTRQRHVHTMEVLQPQEWKNRIDHIVLVTTPQDEANLLEEASGMLSYDYVLLQRVTLVQVREGASSEHRTIHRRTINNKLGPTFHLQLESPTSHLTVARMLWQRTKLGTREGTPTLSHVNPILFRMNEM